jgi:hypothetical protein
MSHETSVYGMLADHMLILIHGDVASQSVHQCAHTFTLFVHDLSVLLCDMYRLKHY